MILFLHRIVCACVFLPCLAGQTTVASLTIYIYTNGVIDLIFIYSADTNTFITPLVHVTYPLIPNGLFPLILKAMFSDLFCFNVLFLIHLYYFKDQSAV